jgi:hypothetical protein
VDDAGFGDGFLGRATRRAGAVVARSAAARALIQHPLLLALCRAVLGSQVLAQRTDAVASEDILVYSQ